MGLAEYRVESTSAVPAGRHTLALRFTRTGPHQGKATLLIDGDAVGEGEIPRTVPHVIETSGEGLCCGYDSGLPVTPDYEAPFRFTGHLEQVVVEIHDDAGAPDREAQLRNAFTDE
jgi:arylsulfatase